MLKFISTKKDPCLREDAMNIIERSLPKLSESETEIRAKIQSIFTR